MEIVSQTVVYLSNNWHGGQAFRSITFIEGSGNIPDQLNNLRNSLDSGLAIDRIEIVFQAPFTVEQT